MFIDSNILFKILRIIRKELVPIGFLEAIILLIYQMLQSQS